MINAEELIKRAAEAAEEQRRAEAAAQGGVGTQQSSVPHPLAGVPQQYPLGK